MDDKGSVIHRVRAQIKSRVEDSGAAPAAPAEGGGFARRAPGKGLSVAMREEAAQLFALLNPPLDEGPGLIVQVIAANPGEGTSTVARAFAEVAAGRTERPVVLADLDFVGSSQHAFFSGMAELSDAGACEDLSHYIVDADSAMRRAAGVFRLERVAETNLLVSRFESRGPGRPKLTGHKEFWQALRSRAALTVVDCPSPKRSYDGISMAGQADATVLVIEAEATRVPVAEDLIEKLNANGGNIVGVVFNKRRFYIPKFVYRWI